MTTMSLSDLSQWVTYFWVAAVMLMGLLFGLLLVPLAVAIIAGVSSPRDSLYFKTSVEAIPVGDRQLVLVDVSSPSLEVPGRVALGRLSHSALYDTPGAIAAVINAIESFDRARDQ